MAEAMRAILIGALLMAVAAVPVQAKGKRYRHPVGFQIQLPDRWTAEPAPAGATIQPPDAKVDPGREDNPEVYWLMAPEVEGTTEQEYVQGVREDLKGSRIAVERDGDLEGFSEAGRPGVIYTFDFVHPTDKKEYRIRIFAMQHNGKTLLLIAKGQRAKVEARDKVLREVARSIEWKK
ncbi:MAG: hypothetical protein R2762_21490 [Bryobacteraceae bacterium]